MRYFVAMILFSALWATPASAMDGVVTETGDAVTVEDGTTFAEGATVAVFDEDGTEHDLQVAGVTDGDDSITVDFIDPETGDAKTVEFMK